MTESPNAGRTVLRARMGSLPQTVFWLASLVPIILAWYTYRLYRSPVVPRYESVGALLVFCLLISFAGRIRRASQDVTFGADGFAYRTLLGQRFIAYADIASVARGGDVDVVVTLRDGRLLKIRPEPKDRDAMATLLLRGTEAPKDVPSPKVLERGPESAASFLAALKVRAPGDYRELPVDPAALREVLASTSAAPKMRLAAAIALHSEDKEPLAQIARTTAHPKLRVALERLDRDDLDDAALAAALDELEAESRAGV